MLPGSAGNVGANTITIVNTGTYAGLGGTNPTATQYGTDTADAGTIQAAINGARQLAYTTATVENAILAASPQPGVYDAYVPTGGSGAFTYYWCDQSAGQAAPVAALVNATLPYTIPPNIAATPGAFTISTVGAVAATYSAPAGTASTSIEPAIRAAIAQYFNGDGQTPRSGLLHNQAPTAFGITQAVLAATGYVPTLFTVGTSFGAAAPTTLYRLGGAATITLTRV